MSLRRPKLALLLGLAVLGASAMGAGAQSFLPGTEDVPLMPGLLAEEGTETVFDTPAGRIVEITATGAVAASRLRAFYAENLEALGWERARGGYRRGGETLKLAVGKAADGTTRVTFILAPAAD